MPYYDLRCKDSNCTGKLIDHLRGISEPNPACPECGGEVETDFSNASFVARVAPEVGNEKKYPPVIKEWLSKRHDQERRKGNL